MYVLYMCPPCRAGTLPLTLAWGQPVGGGMSPSLGGGITDEYALAYLTRAHALVP